MALILKIRKANNGCLLQLCNEVEALQELTEKLLNQIAGIQLGMGLKAYEDNEKFVNDILATIKESSH